jgi:transcriptional regulator with XRE-family HTH domain
MVGSSIKRLRSDRRLTQEDLARLLGVSRQAICMWEADKRELKVSMLKRLAKVFDVSVNEVVKPQVNNMVGKEENMATKCAKKKVDFEISAPDARKVQITGDFTSWNEKGITMKKNKTGLWKTSMSLKPGRYEYKFIVDGQWWTDPANSSIVGNSFGTTNSVVEIISR